MRFSIRTPKEDARYGEAVAKERRKLRAAQEQKTAKKEAERQAALRLQLDAASANAWRAHFSKALFYHLSSLGVGPFMKGWHSPDTLPPASTAFTCTLELDGAADLSVTCTHSGEGVVTFSLGSMRGRFRPDLPADPPTAALEFVSGTAEGDDRWDQLTELAAGRQTGLPEDEWHERVGKALGIDSTITPEAEAAIGRFEQAILAAGFDEARLTETGNELLAATQIPSLSRARLGKQIEDRLG